MNRLFLGIFLFLPLFLASQNDYLESRERMIADDIKSRGVKDKATLRALLEVPRHLFVPQEIRSQAYRDGPLPIGFGQTISQPYIVAFMTEAIKPESNFKVLEIGTGSGYQAAILSRIVDSVYTIEIIDELHLRSNKQLKELGYNNVLTKSADGYYGWEDKGPFDAIVVTAAAEFVPPPLIAQLKEGGRMIIPVGTPFATQQLLMVTKKGGKTKSRNLMFVRFVPFTRKSE